MEKHHKNATPRDSEYVAAYLKHRSQTKAAEDCGCSRETIARACRRAGVKMDGRKLNGRNQEKQQKITDDQLREACRTMNCAEIARKYNMSQERVWLRAKKLGITAKTNGIGGHWYSRAASYGCRDFDDTITLRSLILRDGGICKICGKTVDETDIVNGHIRRLYPTLDHIVPLSKGGSHTWENVQLAHNGCNAGKRDRIEGENEHD